MVTAIGLIIVLFIVGPLACWLAGLGNPMGYMGVLPWRVPKCTCNTSDFHARDCAITRGLPR